MNTLFYIAAVVAIIATIRVITGRNAVHALLYLIVSLLAVSVVFFILGAPFAAALEIIIYAGAIMVLFVFVIMMLNIDAEGLNKEREMLRPVMWIGPTILSTVLLAEMICILMHPIFHPGVISEVPPAEVGRVMFTKYMVVVELGAFLLAAGIIGAYHSGEKKKTIYHRYLKDENLKP